MKKGIDISLIKDYVEAAYSLVCGVDIESGRLILAKNALNNALNELKVAEAWSDPTNFIYDKKPCAKGTEPCDTTGAKPETIPLETTPKPCPYCGGLRGLPILGGGIGMVCPVCKGTGTVSA